MEGWQSNLTFALLTHRGGQKGEGGKEGTRATLIMGFLKEVCKYSTGAKCTILPGVPLQLRVQGYVRFLWHLRDLSTPGRKKIFVASHHRQSLSHSYLLRSAKM